MKANIWLAYDFGVRGDYEGIYEFLDLHKAKECGDSNAFLQFEYKKDLLAELTKELKSHVALDKRSRVYVIYPGSSGKPAGKFIVGSRKAPPWAGHGALQSDEEDVSE